MNKIVKTLIIPFSILTLVGCNGTTTSETSDNSSTEVSSSVEGNNNLSTALDWFIGSVNTVAAYNFFDATTKPRATSVFLEDGCYTTYRNFTNLENTGLINISSALASKYNLEEGVYSWTKENSSLAIGNKVGEGTYQDLYHYPMEISVNKTNYIHSFHHESENEKTDSKAENKLDDSAKSLLNGYFTLNKIFKDEDSEKMLTSFAKSLGVYEILTKADMELNYARIYFGPSAKTMNVTFYTQYRGGYSSYETTVTCSQFGTAKIAELTSYIEAE